MVALPLPMLVRILKRIPRPLLRPFSLLLVSGPAWLAHHHKANKHLDTAFGPDMTPARKRQITRRVAGNLSDFLGESLRIQRCGTDTFDDCTDDAEAREILKRMEAESPTGLLGVTAHIGNWELMAHWCNRNSAVGTGGLLAKRLLNPALETHLRNFRERSGLATIYEDEPAKKALRCLRNRQIVGTAPDRDMKRGAGIFVDFFGRPSYTSIGPARLSIASGAPIFTSFCLRTPSGFKVLMNEPHYPDASRPRDEEIIRLTRAWAGEVEAVIKDHPEQWAWFHDRWKTRPEKLEAQGRRR